MATGTATGGGSRLRRSRDDILKPAPAVLLLMIMRWSGIALQLALTILLGRVLGAAATGTYLLFTSYARFVARLVPFGLPQHVLRSTAVLIAEGHTERSRSFFQRGALLTLAIGAAVFGAAFLADGRLAEILLPGVPFPKLITLAAAAGTLFGAATVLGAALMGQGRPNWSLAIEFNLLPLLLFPVVLLTWFFGSGIAVGTVIYMHVAATAAIVAFAWFAANRLVALRSTGKEAVRKARIQGMEPGTFQVRGLSALWINGLLSAALTTLPMMLLPRFAGPEEIGQFGIAMRVVAVAGTVLNALASYFAPRFASSFAANDVHRLRHSLKLSQAYGVVFYVPILIVTVLFPEFILSIFGNDFPAAAQLLLLLAVGQFFNAMTGIVGMFLSMTHHEKINLRVNIVTVTVLLILTFYLGGLYGATGVAYAVVIATCGKNVVLYLAAHTILRRLDAEAAT